jgi:hypothetical protein
MSETRNIKVIAEGGLLIGNTFVESGKSATVPRERAETLIRSKVAEPFEGAADYPEPYALPTAEETAERKAADAEKRAEPASELAEFAGYAQLNKGGLTTVDGLKAYIVDNPNDWASRLELSDEDAAAIGKKLKPSKAKEKAAAEE